MRTIEDGELIGSLCVRTATVVDSYDTNEIGTTRIWLLAPELRHSDGRTPIVYEQLDCQN